MSLRNPYLDWPPSLKGYVKPAGVEAARAIAELSVGRGSNSSQDVFPEATPPLGTDLQAVRSTLMAAITDNFTTKR